MDRLFPLGFPSPTAFYLTLQVLTFALHQAFMHYVLAGSAYVAWTTTFPGRGENPRDQQPLAAVLRDWMPFLLSAAITAGVAPLLFLQILYKREFYTSNLLLSWRWMIVIPVLIAAFYLLYLLKSKLHAGLPYAARIIVSISTAACFLFVGFCWTANHLLGSAPSAWPDVYITGELPFNATTVVPRMLIWMGGAFSTMVMFTGWQLWVRSKPANERPIAVEGKRMALLALGGLAVSLVAGGMYALRLDDDSRRLLFGSIGLPYVILAIAGIVLQLVGWIPQLKASQLSRTRLLIVTSGTTACLLGVSVLREILRLNAVDVEKLYPRHASAAEIGGFSVFLISAAITGALMAYCVWLVSRGRKESAPK